MAKWFVIQKKADFQSIGQQFGIDQVTARVLRNRDFVETEDIESYLRPDAGLLHDPLLLSGMSEAVDIIREKILEEAPIRIIGDYDVDGVCSTYILLKGLKSLDANVDAVIPHRMHDGYGLNESLVMQARDEHVDTIITCDNGISAASQVEKAKELGLTVIVTDHHDVPETLPPADAVVDPKQSGDKYPFKAICGAMVAFKFVEALYGEFAQDGADFLQIQRELMECGALATVCDVMNVVDENRYIIRKGMEYLKNPSNTGLRALKEVMEIPSEKISYYALGFLLGPCINAAGRLSIAMDALDLLNEEDYGAAKEKAFKLKELNDKRKNMTQEMVDEAIRQTGSGDIVTETAGVGDLNKVLVVYLPNCHQSLTGLVAGRLKEIYSRPVYVFADSAEFDGEITGSGRSIEEYHMYQGLSKCHELFTKYGGHSQAAGLSMPRGNLQEFTQRINEDCGLTEADMVPKIRLDAAMPLSYTNIDTVAREMKLLEPFGPGNHEPVFAQKDLILRRASIYGNSKNVMKLTVQDENNRNFELIQFGNADKFGKIADFLDEKYGRGASAAVFGDSMQYLNSGDHSTGTGNYDSRMPLKISVAYNLGINTYQGIESTQFTLVDYC